MKRFFLLVLLGSIFVTGCSSLYTIKLGNGTTLTSRGKPKLDKDRSVWVYEDPSGEKRTVSVLKVVEVAPASETKSQFISK